VLRAAGLRLAEYAGRRPVLREPASRCGSAQDSILSRHTAPNVVGSCRAATLHGRVPRLLAPWTTSGSARRAGSIAQRETTTPREQPAIVAGLQPVGARPGRSIVFLTVSGEEKGLWGSRYFSEHPTVPLERVVANINIDMIGRNWADTIVAIGKEHSNLGTTLERVNAAHPELGMTAIDDRWPEERFYFRSDHYNFARKGVPILFFFNGVHPDYHEVTDSPEKIDAEKESRILKLLFHLGQEIANAPARPKWNPASRAEIVE
jgi:hypothetical protein